MTQSFQSKSAKIIASVLIGLIITSFLLSGYYRSTGPSSHNSIGSVDGTPIKLSDYRRLYSQRLNLYSQMMGGKALSSQQIEQFKIKESIVDALVQKVLLNNLSEKLGIKISKIQIIDEIKKMPYFKNKETGQFDKDLYKRILAANTLTPMEFEEEIATDHRIQELNRLLSKFPVSENFVKDKISLKSKSLNINGITINKSKLRSFIEVSEKEIENFVNDPNNLKSLEADFNTKKAGLARPEEVKAKHILIRISDKKTEQKAKEEIEKIAQELNTSNFAKMADKYTEDPSGKGKGGDLGYFSRGRMVPAFEDVAFNQKSGQISKPVKTQFGYHIIYTEDKKEAFIPTLALFKDQMAKELIQKKANDKFKKLEQAIIAEAEKNINNIDKLTELSKKYSLSLTKNKEITPFDEKIDSLKLSSQDSLNLFKNPTKEGAAHTLRDAKQTLVLTAKLVEQNKNLSDKEKSEQIKKELQTEEQAFTNALNTEFMKELREKAKIKIFEQFL